MSHPVYVDSLVILARGDRFSSSSVCLFSFFAVATELLLDVEPVLLSE